MKLIKSLTIMLLASFVIIGSCSLERKPKRDTVGSLDNKEKDVDDSGEKSLSFDANPSYDNVNLEEGKYTGSYFIGANERFQSVYSSQNYECFYELYMKAHFYKEPEKRDKVESFEFRIVTYKGTFNIGFAGFDDTKDRQLHFKQVDGKGILGLKIFVQARSGKNEMKYKVPEALNITKENVNQLNVFRMLIPLDGIKGGVQLAIKNNIFDSEFYRREGIELNRKKIVPKGHYDFDKPNDFGPDIEKIAEPDFAESELVFEKNNKEYTILAKDSNCYTSTMYVQ